MYKPLGFTDKECLYNKVTHARMMHYLRTCKVISSKRSHNNYGEFRFVTIRKVWRKFYSDGRDAQVYITFYGNGYHEYREAASDTWEFYVDYNNYCKDNTPVNKAKVISEIESERKDYSFSDSNNLFSQIADISDDDFAMSYMELEY